MRRAGALPPSSLVAAAVAAYAAGFGALSVLRHRAFETGRFDLGNMTQAVWSTAHGHPLAITDLGGEQIVRLAAHVDPILVLLAPLWWVWPSPELLLVVQALAVALGAVPVFRLARKHVGSEHAAAGFALAYLLLPATQWLTLNEFHPVALACPLLLWAFWYLDEDRLVPFAAFVLLACATKEEVPLVVAGFGAWYAISRGRRRAGLAIASLAVAWSAVAIGIVMPHFNGGSSSSFYSRYAEIGGSPGGVVRTTLHHPLRILDAAFEGRDLHYLLELLGPLAGLFLLAPVLALAALPELALNLLSATPTQTSIRFHYVAAAIPPLVAASVLGAGRLVGDHRHRAAPVAAFAVAAALAANFLTGAVPVWHRLPGGLDDDGSAAIRVSQHDAIATRALDLIPRTAPVSATNTLGAHLSARRRFLSFPILEDAEWIAVDEQKPSYLDRTGPRATAARLAWLRHNPEWRVVFEEDGVLIFRRVAG